MLNHLSSQKALRTRLRDLSVATTGTTSLAATSTGYSRAAGSFVTDGFHPGMEVLVSGFATAGLNGYKVLTEVTATTLKIDGGNSATESASGNELIVCGLPEKQVWENTSLTPTVGRPYIEEEYVPGPFRTVSFPAQSGSTEERVDYFVRWYFLPNYGMGAVRTCLDAVVALFAPGTTITTGASQVLRVRTQVAPRASQIIRLDSGWMVSTIQIALEAETTNVVTA